MIESIDRALAVLQLFLKEERPLSVTRISKLMDLHKSTVSRTMDTLERRGFVQKDSETGKYWLGLQVYALGMLFREKDAFPKVAYPYAKALSLQCNEGVHITTFAHNGASYPQHIILEKIKSPRTPGRLIRHRLSVPSVRRIARPRASASWLFHRNTYTLIRAARCRSLRNIP